MPIAAIYITTGSVTTVRPNKLAVRANLRAAAASDSQRHAIAKLVNADNPALWIITGGFNMVTDPKDRANYDKLENPGTKDLEQEHRRCIDEKPFDMYEISQALHTNRHSGGTAWLDRVYTKQPIAGQLDRATGCTAVGGGSSPRTGPLHAAV